MSRITKIALVQQKCSDDIAANQKKGIDAVRQAAEQGAQIICFAELVKDSHAKKLFLPDRRPDLCACFVSPRLKKIFFLGIDERYESY